MERKIPIFCARKLAAELMGDLGAALKDHDAALASLRDIGGLTILGLQQKRRDLEEGLAAANDKLKAAKEELQVVRDRIVATLDKALDAIYLAAEKAAGRKPPKLSTDAERVAFLFERYQALTSLLPADKPKKARKGKAA